MHCISKPYDSHKCPDLARRTLKDAKEHLDVFEKHFIGARTGQKCTCVSLSECCCFSIISFLFVISFVSISFFLPLLLRIFFGIGSQSWSIFKNGDRSLGLRRKKARAKRESNIYESLGRRSLIYRVPRRLEKQS